jgi:hypothetical protein
MRKALKALLILTIVAVAMMVTALPVMAWPNGTGP